jgi:Fe-S cluster biogenesis protein NfuA
VESCGVEFCGDIEEDNRLTICRKDGVNHEEGKMDEKSIRDIIDQIKPALARDGGNIEFISIAGGVVKVKLTGACGGCPMSQMTLKNYVERTIKEKLPEVKAVVAE